MRWADETGLECPKFLTPLTIFYFLILRQHAMKRWDLHNELRFLNIFAVRELLMARIALFHESRKLLFRAIEVSFFAG